MSDNPNYSSKLSNEDLIPAQQNWTWYNIFSFWMSDVHSMGGYVVAASLFSLGLASWQVLLALLIGIVIVQVAANLVAKPSQISGVPYAVISRQAFGIYGAYIPALIRGLIAVSWYGIQTWLASNALMMILLKFYPALHPLTLTEFAGLSTIGWICFGFIWAIQALVFWKGMDTIKVFIDWAGPMVYVVMLALALWLVWKSGWHHISFNLSDKHLSVNQQIMQTIVAIALVVSYFSGPLLNFGDFSRYGKNMQQVKKGNFWGLPFNFMFFAIIVVMIVSGTFSVFGKMVHDPLETVAMIDNGFVVVLGLLTVLTATIGINIVANFVSAGFDFSNLAPRFLNFRRAGMIAAIGSIFITPWNLFNSPELIHYTLDTLAAFIGPLFGILLADFYLINKQKVRVDDLFSDQPTAAYYYQKGINKKAVMSLVAAVSIGLLLVLIPSFQFLAPFNWFIGVMLGSSFYYRLSRESVVIKAKRIRHQQSLNLPQNHQ
ncbi:permease [Acinetobacter gyllenbergii]|uniref:NCS1 family nucleobase:cation symporter-1 n=1 Tax=Acinetobacter gyllenbergii CIP 110306 = MTCC 11365 TaxID=1217657 RepID=A0A829HLQ2_9GAMM|nr:NCS1 family nucleobase:cation symporter-1 [Acinetobacter gyllenbergii]EPF92380.1 NCS1 family nucleobase:cation symporter-1 [Acinetobacter gyllenbergii CIP 110306 = MTCC 11365]EPH34875.1 Cytosine/purine/uracil/thiamine/allantoin permease family protein [Acinetobacter gyllenbergii CIP 110306 = MTCC 11365]GMA10494.1 permease [Acinetobacter gyllenbergii]